VLGKERRCIKVGHSSRRELLAKKEGRKEMFDILENKPTLCDQRENEYNRVFEMKQLRK
jgi:hypothetical protein